jgi:hypothetical protein
MKLGQCGVGCVLLLVAAGAFIVQRRKMVAPSPKMGDVLTARGGEPVLGSITPTSPEPGSVAFLPEIQEIDVSKIPTGLEESIPGTIGPVA